jgi:hypothetical protein
MQTTLLIDANCPDPDLVAAHLDSTGGMAITAPGIQKLSLAHKDLRALDVHASPELLELDLSRCPSQEFHLTLINCPSLKAVKLPRGGAYVHLDSPASPKVLHITGGVKHLDANWRETIFRTDSTSDRTWSQVWIMSATADINNLQSGKHPSLSVLVNPTLSNHTLTLNHSATDLIISGSTLLERLIVNSSHDTIKIGNTPRLTVAGFEKPVTQVEFDQCPNLKAIVTKTKVEALALRNNSGAQDLEFSIQSCDEIVMADSATAIVGLTQVERLRLIRCRNLESIKGYSELDLECESCIPICILDQKFKSVSLTVDETVLNDIKHRCLNLDDRALKELEVVLPYASHGRLLAKCLMHIAEMAKRGFAPSTWFWGLRNTLHYQNQSGEPQGWSWHMPPDLGEDAWRADLEIWFACEGLIEARSYTETIADGILLNEQVPASILSSESMRAALEQSKHERLFILLFQRAKSLNLDRHKRAQLLRLAEKVQQNPIFNDPDFRRLRRHATDFFVSHSSFERVLAYFSLELLACTPEERRRTRIQINQIINGMSQSVVREDSEMSKQQFISELQRLLLS